MASAARLLSRRRLFAPHDIAALVYFRIAFGAIMLWEVGRYFEHGWIARYWIEPAFHFTYYGFGWVQPWPGAGMYVHFAALGVLAFFIMIGLWYRLSAALFFLGFTYAFLLEEARYLNHFYLISLLSFLLIFVPAHRACSVDVWRRPALRRRTAPAWALYLLRFQIGVAYVFGGIAKLNADWLRGEPMRLWLARRTDVPVLGPFFTEEWMVYLFSYGGLAFDLLVVPLLLWRRTRPFAFGAAVLFHLTNAYLFSIGIFPWFMIAATALFFAPGWPRRLLRRLRPSLAAPPQPPHTDAASAARPAWQQRAVCALLAAYVAMQVALPLRHLLYPGNPSWTEEGHRFAWHMKLRQKRGEVRFFVRQGGPRVAAWAVDPRDYLTSWQARKMAGQPDMILQFAHFLADEMRRAADEPEAPVEVRAHAQASLNGRPPQALVDSAVNLATQQRSLWPAFWIQPLAEALAPPAENRSAERAVRQHR